MLWRQLRHHQRYCGHTHTHIHPHTRAQRITFTLASRSTLNFCCCHTFDIWSAFPPRHRCCTSARVRKTSLCFAPEHSEEKQQQQQQQHHSRHTLEKFFFSYYYICADFHTMCHEFSLWILLILRLLTTLIYVLSLFRFPLCSALVMRLSF